ARHGVLKVEDQHVQAAGPEPREPVPPVIRRALETELRLLALGGLAPALRHGTADRRQRPFEGADVAARADGPADATLVGRLAGGAAAARRGRFPRVDRRTAGEEPVSERRTAVVGEGGEPRVDAGPIGAGEPARPVAVEVVGVAHRDEAADGAAGAV